MSGERTEKATPKRRNEARKKGQVARSTEVNSTVVLLAAVSALALAAPTLGSSLRGLLSETMGRVARPEVTGTTIGGLIGHWAQLAFSLMIPVLAAAAGAAILASVIQNKPAITPAAIRVDFKKLSPVGGIKRLVGTNSWVEVAKSLVKIVLVAAVGAAVIWPEIDSLATLGDQPPSAILDVTDALIVRLAFFILALLVPLATADAIWQRRQHEKSLRMSKQEVKEEARQSDVAPEIKGAIRRRQMQMSRQRMLAQVPSADVIVTNPTHFAVALRYGKDVSAPRVVAKGADLLAKRIREIAAEHDVAIVENAPLARTLYAEVDVDQEIPADLFAAVAEILAFVYRTSSRKLSWV